MFKVGDKVITVAFYNEEVYPILEPRIPTGSHEALIDNKYIGTVKRIHDKYIYVVFKGLEREGPVALLREEIQLWQPYTNTKLLSGGNI